MHTYIQARLVSIYTFARNVLRKLRHLKAVALFI
jgi:hypothetical protein